MYSSSTNNFDDATFNSFDDKTFIFSKKPNQHFDLIKNVKNEKLFQPVFGTHYDKKRANELLNTELNASGSVFEKQIEKLKEENSHYNSESINFIKDEITMSSLWNYLNSREYSSPEYQPFRPLEFLRHLKTEDFARNLLIYSEKTSSTQNFLHSLLNDNLLKKNQLEDLEGTLFVTDQQQSGTGRGSSTWESPPGCLMFSCILTSSNGQRLPAIQYLIAIAVIRALRSITAPHIPPVRLKWPNDIYALGNPTPPNRQNSADAQDAAAFTASSSWRKVGGILCHSVYQEGVFGVVCGVGINLWNGSPTMSINDVIANMNTQRRRQQVSPADDPRQRQNNRNNNTFSDPCHSKTANRSMSDFDDDPKQYNYDASSKPESHYTSEQQFYMDELRSGTSIDIMTTNSKSNDDIPFITKERFLAEIMNELEGIMHQYHHPLGEQSHSNFSQNQGSINYRNNSTPLDQYPFDMFCDEYCRYWMHSRQHVHLEREGKDVEIAGINEEGCLIAVSADDNGQVFELHPDGLSFDLRKCTIKKKK